MTTLAIAVLSCAIWVYLLVARGGFWREAGRDDARLTVPPVGFIWPRVVAVIAARDEALLIGETIATLLRQDYSGSFAVVVVDDQSSDGTAAVAHRAAAAAGGPARVTILSAPDLPEGWTGKLWALHHGIKHVEALPETPDYLLLTDADIRFADDMLTELVVRAGCDRLVLMSQMAKLRCVSFAERAFIPAFVFFFQMLYPFAWVNRADRTTAAAAGGCMLLHFRTLLAVGGIEAIHDELIDDCALARLLKPHGSIFLGLSERVRSARAYQSIGDVRRMVSRSAYAQLRFSPWRLVVVAAAMIVTFLVPPALALLGSGTERLLGVLAWVQMALALQPTLRFYGMSAWWGLALPAIAGTYLAFTLDSAYRHAVGVGGEWKGRIHRGRSSHEISGRCN